MKKRVVFLLLAIALTGLIVFTSLNTGSTYNSIGGVIGPWVNRVFFFGRLSDAEVSILVGFGSKFLGHFWLFSLTGLFYWLFFRAFPNKKNALFVALLLLGAFLASLGETIQIFTAGRYPSFADVLLNFMGFIFLPVTCVLFLRFNASVLPSEDVVKEDREN